MVKVICNQCKGIGFKSYPFGKNSSCRRSIKHRVRCKYNKNKIN